LCANLVSNTVSGNVTVTWVINFASGQQCTYQSSVKNCPHPKTKCDDFKYSQGNCTGGALCFVDFTITNQMAPSDPICKVKIEKFDSFGALQTSYWNTGIGISPAATYGSPWNLYPSVGSLSVATGGVVHFQNYFPAPGPMTGYTVLTVYHCSGDSCVSTYRPKIINPVDLANFETAKLLNVKPKFPKMFGTAYRLLPNAQTGKGLESLGVKYVSVGVVTATTGTNPEIVAITGAEAYAERDPVATKSIPLHIYKSGHGKQNAFFEFNDPIRLLRGDTSEYLHIIYADAPPVKVAYTMYGEDGGIISVDTANVETTTTTTVGLVDNKPQENEVFMIAGTPNPTAGVYQIRYANNKLQNINFVIYDTVGKIVLTVSEKNMAEGVHDKSLDLSVLGSGLYIIRMTTNDGKEATTPLKVVIQK
jgi:Secretion system C-terminal sorting domain